MQDKSSLRKELLTKRDAIPPVVKKTKDRAIHQLLLSLDEFKYAKAILLFASFRSEVDTFEFIKLSLVQGRRVVLPRVNRQYKNLALFEMKDLSELSEGYMGIPEPPAAEDRTFSLKAIDLIIIPGAGFDPSGNRIGYGGGYYDRLLSDLPEGIPVIAPAYEEQILDAIPSESHDKKVHLIVTDRRVIRCRECMK